jgi:hypothetical protein
MTAEVRGNAHGKPSASPFEEPGRATSFGRDFRARGLVACTRLSWKDLHGVQGGPVTMASPIATEYSAGH